MPGFGIGRRNHVDFYEIFLSSHFLPFLWDPRWKKTSLRREKKTILASNEPIKTNARGSVSGEAAGINLATSFGFIQETRSDGNGGKKLNDFFFASCLAPEIGSDHYSGIFMANNLMMVNGAAHEMRYALGTKHREREEIPSRRR